MTEKNPKSPDGWRALGRLLIRDKQYEKARQLLEYAREVILEDHVLLEQLGYCYQKLGKLEFAETISEEVLKLKPNSSQAYLILSSCCYDRGHKKDALRYVKNAERIAPDDVRMLDRLGTILYALHHYEEASEVFEKLIQKDPRNFSHWNNAANARRDLGLLDEANTYYQRAVDLAGTVSSPYSNRLTLLHYLPDIKPETIFEVCREWQPRFAPASLPDRPVPCNKKMNRRLRLGMVSDGFNRHPAGKMIIRALENLHCHDFECFAYSTNGKVDSLTKRIRSAISHWENINHLTAESLAEKIRDDKIDILVDLSGHNSGNRMYTMALQPAPVIVKWVGGLINTTGVKAIDYLLSDSVETPEGVDGLYTEKLIRMPDDYICFDIPDKVPSVSSLPAKDNGYITLGCFNNPTKINEVVFKEWAKIMHQLPDSRLFLKGRPYASDSFCERLYQTMECHDIARERLIIEGPGSNYELLEAYNRMDIALDPWPYSGGLTTCEAFLMGVPVVTMPGPTFAGRHSATHLVNAGMPELVTNSWDEYRERVLELAGDLDSLSTIRQHLREVLTKSPVCDGPRFAKHFTTAMRAIWQRYCEDKAPAALTFNKEGQAWFDDEDDPVHIEPVLDDAADSDDSGFRFQFEGKVIAIDNGGELLNHAATQQMLSLNAFEVITFDPRSEALQHSLIQHEGVHHYPNTSLGDGQPATLYTCLDPSMTATLPPLPSEDLSDEQAQGAKVLAQLPLNTIALDKIEGLPSLDWLVLDDRCDAGTILENGKTALKDTLLIQARITFQPTHEGQTTLDKVTAWAQNNSFLFYRLNNLQHKSHLPARDDLIRHQATELTHADVLLLPSQGRMESIDDNQKMKLAFLLHTAYGMKDMAYKIISIVDEEKADEYLIGEQLVFREQTKIDDVSSHDPDDEDDTIADEIDKLLGRT